MQSSKFSRLRRAVHHTIGTVIILVNSIRPSDTVYRLVLRIVQARSYPRENIGDRAYATCKSVLRVVAARSYPRENIGDRAYAA